MFRKMRRFNQQLSEKEAEEMLTRGKTGVLGVSGDDGYPYTVPVNYVYNSGKIYFHCAKEGHKIDSILRLDKVSFCVIERDEIVSEKLTDYFKSVIAFGKARILKEDKEVFAAAEMLGLKYNSDKNFVRDEINRLYNSLACVEITVEHMTAKAAKELL